MNEGIISKYVCLSVLFSSRTNYLAFHEIYMGLERDKYSHVLVILVLIWENNVSLCDEIQNELHQI